MAAVVRCGPDNSGLARSAGVSVQVLAMTSQPFQSTGPLLSQQTINWAMLAFLLAFRVQIGVGVSAVARAQAEIRELRETI